MSRSTLRETELARWHRLHWLDPDDVLNDRLFAAGFLLGGLAAGPDDRGAPMQTIDLLRTGIGSRAPDALWPVEAQVDRLLRAQPTYAEVTRHVPPQLLPPVNMLVVEDRGLEEIAKRCGAASRGGYGPTRQMVQAGLWLVAHRIGVLG